jgi:hypothetical protein
MAANTQVTFKEYQIPQNTDFKNYRLVVDYYSDKQIIIPVKQAGKVYSKNTVDGSFNEITEGLFITAFYANNGDLYLVENADTSGYEPHLYKSDDNGKTLSEIAGVAGRLFQRDQFGNLYYSVPGGFAYSVDEGKTFKTVSASNEIFSVARNPSGKLFYMTGKWELFRTINEGGSWENISKQLSTQSTRTEQKLWWKSDTLYFQSGNFFNYATESGTKWEYSILPSTSIITNVCLSPDNIFYCTSPYGFFSSLFPVKRNWTLLLSGFEHLEWFTPANETIYNNFIAIKDNFMYVRSFYAPRIPSVISTVKIGREQQFNIYPNPASEKIQILNGNTKGEIKIFNIQGKLMLTETITEPNQTINIQALKSGIYIWEMGNVKGKLVVQ